MANRISLLKSEVVGQIPTASAMASGELAVNYADKKIYGKHPASGAVVQVAASPIHSHQISEVVGLQDALDDAGGGAQVDSYSEPTYTTGQLTALTTWSDNSKSVLVETKTFTYTNGLLSQIVVTDGNGATTLTKTLTYSGDDLASITKDYA